MFPKLKSYNSFNTVDTNEDGVISREKFMAAAEDYFCGVEETEVSKVFLGRLVKWSTQSRLTLN